MMKVKLDSNEEQANAFVEKIQDHPLLSDYKVTLNNVNDFALYLEERENCLKCRGILECKNSTQGFATQIAEGCFTLSACKYKKEVEAKAREHRFIHTLFVSKSVLNSDLKDFEVCTPNRKKIYEHILQFIPKIKQHEFTKGLYIYGGFSTGKTFILGCIANELARNHVESLVIYFPDLVVELKNAIGTPRFEQLINHLKSVEVLLLDDLGSENMTPWLRDEILGPILNYRLMEGKALFVSSNLDPTRGDLIQHFTTSKAASEVLKASRIQSRLEGLVMLMELENKPYRR